jgi:septum site-determining protein MinD
LPPAERAAAGAEARRTAVVTVYSWAGGTGRTQIVASLGVLLAGRGLRVGLLDTNLAAPGLHVLFGLLPAPEAPSLADYLFGDREIETVGYDVTAELGPARSKPGAGALIMVPSWISDADELGHALARHVDVGLLADGIERLARECALDVLLLDTQNGVNRAAVVALLAADLQLLLVTGAVGEREGMALLQPLVAAPERVLPVHAGPTRAAAAVQDVFGIPVATVLPHAPELYRLGRAGQFVHTHPRHPLTLRLTELADRIHHRVAPAG